MALDDIVGYTYKADNYCPEHIGKVMTPSGINTASAMGTEEMLDKLAEAAGIDRYDESSYDSGDFPKVIFRDQASGEACGYDGQPLTGTTASKKESTVKSEAELLQAMAYANPFEQKKISEQLDRLRTSRTASVTEARQLNLLSEDLRSIAPVATHGLSRQASDWVLDDPTSFDLTATNRTMLAEASLWFDKVASEVKEDTDEFTVQAQGIARRTASAYGEQAEAAERAFLDHVAFLNRGSTKTADKSYKVIQDDMNGGKWQVRVLGDSGVWGDYGDPVDSEEAANAKMDDAKKEGSKVANDLRPQDYKYPPGDEQTGDAQSGLPQIEGPNDGDTNAFDNFVDPESAITRSSEQTKDQAQSNGNAGGGAQPSSRNAAKTATGTFSVGDNVKVIGGFEDGITGTIANVDGGVYDVKTNTDPPHVVPGLPYHRLIADWETSDDFAMAPMASKTARDENTNWDTGEVELWFDNDESLYNNARMGEPNAQTLQQMWEQSNPNATVDVNNVDWDEVAAHVAEDIEELQGGGGMQPQPPQQPGFMGAKQANDLPPEAKEQSTNANPDATSKLPNVDEAAPETMFPFDLDDGDTKSGVDAADVANVKSPDNGYPQPTGGDKGDGSWPLTSKLEEFRRKVQANLDNL